MNACLTCRGSVDQRTECTQDPSGMNLSLSSHGVAFLKVFQADFQESNPEWPSSYEPQLPICKASRVIHTQLSGAYGMKYVKES